jgi:hypothetical protein
MGIRTSAVLAALVLISITASAWSDAFAQERTVPEAPVGHRQPTASDVPKDEPVTPADKAIEELDQALAKKLQGTICRGC